MSWTNGWDGPHEPLELKVICAGCGEEWTEEALSVEALEDEAPLCSDCGCDGIVQNPEEAGHDV